MTHDDLTLNEDELRPLLEGQDDAEGVPDSAGISEEADGASAAEEVDPPPEADDREHEPGPEPATAEPPPAPRPKPTVKVQPVQFGPLQARVPAHTKERLDLGILFDVPLRVTVELGRTQMSVRQLLELGPGSVIELDRSAGEVLDVLVNGVPIAQGEVVVVDEQFGVRITQVFEAPGRDLVDSISGK